MCVTVKDLWRADVFAVPNLCFLCHVTFTKGIRMHTEAENRSRPYFHFAVVCYDA